MGGLTQRESLVALAHCVEPGDASVGRLVRQHGAAEVVAWISARRTGLRQDEGLAARLAHYSSDESSDRLRRSGARIVTRADREWPTQLDDLGDTAPLALWVVGAADLRLLALRSVAIVGARACSAYGEEIARTWASELAVERWCVLSGAAFGIDAAAHRGALAAGGTTIAVLAGGVDVPYPRAHEALLARIADDGLVVSETPPGEQVRRQRFLSRNRLIAALGRATVVVEAAERSGTTATARAAGAMNRPVVAVPGPVTAVTSSGCHRMIRDAEAMLAATVADVLDLLDLGSSDRRAGRPEVATSFATSVVDGLGDRERRVLDALPSRAACDLATLVRAAGLSGTDVLAAVGILAARGLVEERTTGWRLTRPAAAEQGRAPTQRA